MTRTRRSLLLFRSEKEQTPMAKLKTYFEQIPLAVAKKIAEEELRREADKKNAAQTKETRSDNVEFETVTMKTEPYSIRVTSPCRVRL
jgi:hypothetical protein